MHLDGRYANLLRAGGRDGNPLSPTTVIHVHAVMSKLLSDALRKGVVVRNVAALRSHRARQSEERLAWGPAYEDGNLVFCRENGTPLHPNEITHAFSRLVTRAGLPKIRLHDVRHSAVTAMLRSGIPVKVVACDRATSCGSSR